MSLLTTNWPNEFSDLKKLDGILQCPICYEYINTCMITSCSHNFCSVCIRKYLQYKTQCPTCSEETYGSDLRKNRPLDEIITIYKSVKEHLLYKLRLINVTQSIKESQTDPNICNGFSTTPKKSDSDTNTDRDTPKTEKPKKAVVQKLFSVKKENKQPEPLVIGGVTIPTIFQPQKSPKKSINSKKTETKPCPVCNVDVPEKNINLHLDFCLAAADPLPQKPKPKPEIRKPLVKLVCSMLKEKEIKRHLKDHGLNTNGDRKTLIWRLNRYTVLYNAECDCENPRAISDLVKQVEKEEKEEKSSLFFQAPKAQKVVIDKKTDPETIEKVNKEYLQMNKSHFDSLIESMRQRHGQNVKPLKPMNRIDSDDEEKPQVNSTFDNQLPSTSKASDMDNLSVYSQETIVDSGSEDDIFEKSPVKVEPDVHQIDWNKTKVKEDSTQDQDKSITEEKEADSSVIHDEDSNSYESVFDKSTSGASVKTPVGKAHSLSARRNSKTPSTTALRSPTTPSGRKMEEMVDEIFEQNSDQTTIRSEDESESEEDDADESGDEGFEFKTPVKKYDMSPELSPMKTRSKRKCAPSTEEKKLTSSARRKRVKRSVSPCY